MSNKTSPCKKCGDRYRVLTKEGLCYNCHLDKYNEVPKDGPYRQDKEDKK